VDETPGALLLQVPVVAGEVVAVPAGLLQVFGG
jgi:hypothetical protein